MVEDLLENRAQNCFQKIEISNKKIESFGRKSKYWLKIWFCTKTEISDKSFGRKSNIG